MDFPASPTSRPVDASRHRKAEVVADRLREDPGIPHGGWYRVRVNGQNLDEFAASLRNAHAKGRLHPKTVRLLHSTPGWEWSGVVARRREVLMDFREQVEAHGTAAIPPGMLGPADEDLRDEAAALRAAHRDGTLQPEFVESFSALPGWAWAEDAALAQGVVAGFQRMRTLDDDEVLSVRQLAGETGFTAAERHLASLAGSAADPVRHLLDGDPWWSWDEQATLARATMWMYAQAAAAVNADIGSDDLREPDEADLTDDEWPTMYRSGQPFDRNWPEPREVFNTWGAVRSAALGNASQPDGERRYVEGVQTFIAVHGHSDVGWELHNAFRSGRHHLHVQTRRALDALPGWAWTAEEARRDRYLPAAAAWAAEHDTDILPSDLTIDDEEVGAWAYHFHSDRGPRIDDEEVLDAFPTWEDMPRAAYQQKAAALQWRQYYQDHGHVDLFHATDAPPNLAHAQSKWVNAQPRWAEYPHFIEDEYRSLPHWPGTDRNLLERWAIVSTVQAFIDREGPDTPVPPGHVEAGFPLHTTLRNVIRFGGPDHDWEPPLDQVRDDILRIMGYS